MGNGDFTQCRQVALLGRQTELTRRLRGKEAQEEKEEHRWQGRAVGGSVAGCPQRAVPNHLFVLLVWLGFFPHDGLFLALVPVVAVRGLELRTAWERVCIPRAASEWSAGPVYLAGWTSHG